MGLSGDEFMNKPANEYFKTDFDMDQVRDGLSFEEDLTYFAEMTGPYKAHKAIMSPTGVPMFELQNSNRSDGPRPVGKSMRRTTSRSTLDSSRARLARTPT